MLWFPIVSGPGFKSTSNVKSTPSVRALSYSFARFGGLLCLKWQSLDQWLDATSRSTVRTDVLNEKSSSWVLAKSAATLKGTN